MPEALIAKKGFKFGCDPEMFIQNSDGVLVSAHDLLPGTKEEPHPVQFGAVQVDGVAAEFNIDPVDNFRDFNRNITAVLGQLKKMLPKGHSLVFQPHVVFNPDVWDSIPESAKVLGCTPDYNAWSGDANSPPDGDAYPRMRTASGHIHIGWEDKVDTTDPQHILNCFDLVKQLDYFLGAWSLSQDEDAVRRVLYGKAGACRIKPYGVEYRVLSNFWLTTTARRQAVWDRLQMAIQDMANKFIPDSMPGSANAKLISMINSSHRDAWLESKLTYPIRTITQPAPRNRASSGYKAIKLMSAFGDTGAM